MTATAQRPTSIGAALGAALGAAVVVAILLPATLAAAGPAAGAALELEDLGAWYRLESQCFSLATNATPARAADLLHNLELFRTAFARLAPGLELRSPTPTRLTAFRDADAYAPYKVPSDPRIVGQFVRRFDVNHLTFDAGAGERGAFGVVYHEYVHYLVDSNFPAVPRWFNEGLAEYYSTFAVDGDRAVLGRPVAEHVRWVKGDTSHRARSLDHDFSLRDVLTGEAAHDERVGRFYAFSWALVHYLLSGGDERLAQASDYLVRLLDGEDADDAFEAAFDASLDELEEEVRAYVEAGDFPTASFAAGGADAAITAAAMAPADVLAQLGELALDLGGPAWAEAHYQAALALDGEHPGVLAGLARLRDLEGRFAEAEILHRDALARPSRDPRIPLRYGVHLLQQLLPGEEGAGLAAGQIALAGELGSVLREGEPKPTADPAAARAAFRRAIELDDEYAAARILFAAAHLEGEVDPTPGIEALEKVRRWQPLNHGLTFLRLRLELKRGAFDVARRLFATDLETRADPDLVNQASEEIERADLLHRAAQAFAEDRVDDALQLFDEAVAATSDPDLRQRLADKLLELQAAHRPPP